MAKPIVNKKKPTVTASVINKLKKINLKHARKKLLRKRKRSRI
jgi:hypothetical protein